MELKDLHKELPLKSLFLNEPKPSLDQIKLNLDERLDFLSSGRWIIQRKKGHRATSDDQILAWFMYSSWYNSFPPRVLELGAGKATISLILSVLWPQAHFVGIEAYKESHQLAQKNIQLNRLDNILTPIFGDLRDPHILEKAMSTLDHINHHSNMYGQGQVPHMSSGFDLICGAPPFMPLGSGILPSDPQRVSGRFELKGGVEDYLTALARCLSPQLHSRGFILMDGQSHTRTVKALATHSNLSLLRRILVCPRPHRPVTYEIFEIGHADFHSINTESEVTTLYQRGSTGNQWSQAYQNIRHALGVQPSNIPWIFVPARLQSTRLKTKALLDIHGAPMISRVFENLSRHFHTKHLVITSDSAEIIMAAQSQLSTSIHECLITAPCDSGSQRVCLAYNQLADRIPSPWIINVQGDEPLLPMTSLEALMEALIHFERQGTYIVTLACPLATDSQQRQLELSQNALVKVCIGELIQPISVRPHHQHTQSWRRALFFTRQATGTHQHLGVYAFHRRILPLIAQKKRVLAELEDLEQLSWLEAGANIGVVCLNQRHPKGVDTPEDLVHTRNEYKQLLES